MKIKEILSKIRIPKAFKRFTIEILSIALISSIVPFILFGFEGLSSDSKNWILSFQTTYLIIGGLYAGYSRVAKKHRDESSFQKVNNDLKSVVEKLEDRFDTLITKFETETENLLKYLHGGDLCYFNIELRTKYNGEYVCFDLVSHSDLPIYSININFDDNIIRYYEHQADLYLPEKYRQSKTIDFILPNDTFEDVFMAVPNEHHKGVYHIKIQHRNQIELIQMVYIINDRDGYGYNIYYDLTCEKYPAFNKSVGFENLSELEISDIKNIYSH